MLDKVKEVRNNDRLVLNLTYHPSIMNFQNFLNEVHILLTPNKEHHKYFRDKPPMIGGHVLKQRSLSAKIKCEPSSRNKCETCCRFSAKFLLLLRKLKLFKTRIKVKHLTLEKGF